MKITGALLLSLVITLSSFGQGKKDSLAIGFLFIKTPVRDTMGMVLRVVYKNLTDRDVMIYRELKEGVAYDPYYNVVIRLERKVNGRFQNYVTSFGDPIASDTTDRIGSLRHVDMPKKKLAPFATDTLALDLMANHSLIDTGEYRLSARLKIRTIRNNDPRKYDDIIFRSSGWIYFRVDTYLSLYFLRKARR